MLGLGQDDGELVAPDPTRDVDRAGGVAHALGGLGQHAVAGEVPDAVVDQLEVVEVEDDQREVAPVPLRPEDLAPQGLVEVALVEETRQGVRLGELARLAEAPRVLDRGHRARGETLGGLDLLAGRLPVRVRQKSASVPRGRSSRPSSGTKRPPRISCARGAPGPARSGT